MPTYGQLLLLILPVFALVAVGVVLRRRHWVEGPAEASLLRLVVAVCYPCLIFDAVVGNAAMRAPGNVWLPPLVGFLLAVGGIAVAWQAGRWLRLREEDGLRSFALAAGIGNFGYIPIPIIDAIWGRDTLGVLLVHNVGGLYDPRITWGSAAVRLGAMPLVILVAARWFPGSPELKRVLVIEAAMPSAVFPIVVARLHQGHPRTAVQIVLGTTILGVLVIPLWIRLGLAWVGL